MTYEEVKQIRRNPTAENCDNQKLQKMIDDAIDKQIPYPTGDKFVGKCKCGKTVYPHMKFCNICGQALDWNED